VFDILINKQLMTHLLTYDLISPHNFAFRPYSDCSLALQTIFDKISLNKKSGRPTLAIFLDLSKAYDTINHDILLHHLQHRFNFDENTTNLFRSYFTNRQQSTHTPAASSTTSTITDGIPQGSTLSTTLFLLYANDIANIANHALDDSNDFPTSSNDTGIYADDSTFIISAATTTELHRAAQRILDTVVRYLHSIFLVPNASKTTYTTFSPTSFPDFDLRINGAQINHEPHTKLLGLYISNNLKWHRHIIHITQKLNYFVHILRNVNKILPTATLINLYYQLAYPHLIANIPLWGSSLPSATYLQPLHRLQKKILRLMANVPPFTYNKTNDTYTYTRSAPLFTRFEILDIFKLFTYRSAIDIRHYIHPAEPKPNDLPRSIPTHTTDFQLINNVHNYPTRLSKTRSIYIPNKTTSISTSTKTRATI
jgi:hypothetical protein